MPLALSLECHMMTQSFSLPIPSHEELVGKLEVSWEGLLDHNDKPFSK
jgi:hypothetical protein